jgi:hypothetical protein
MIVMLDTIRVIKLERSTRWSGVLLLGTLERSWQLFLNTGTTAPLCYFLSDRFADVLREHFADKLATGEKT